MMDKWKGWLGLIVTAAMSACTQQAPKQSDAEIMGGLMQSSWRIESIQSGGVIDYSPAQLTFAAEGKFSGNGTCNRIFGEYSVSGERLVIADKIGATRRMCPPALMNQEQRLLQVLPGEHSVELKDGILTLLNSEGDEVIRAAAVSL
ncbi:META domain-containing protein [Gilvimarinus chinensis]|uniref:META domain-containing protein n=1 Tax=Gilvimarinus chinensis TaxID=396005 RepID=UPI00036E1068|nr:META domain-containing protein [Gilvimarinus chinensis]